MATSTQQATTVEVYGGREVEVRRVWRRGDTVRLDIRCGARWVVDISRFTTSADDVDVVTTWNTDGQLADVPLPEWIDDLLMRLR
ncbi:hypothetical protein [Haloarchaeobius sp. HRN-SO-5]|uniref:hypothetical protein n=1 Tax=Haloarchaeobius sp. HRN-SO-5 TaxID=3446118 RepID=UPI003EBC040D